MSKARAQRWRCLGLRTRIPTSGSAGASLLWAGAALATGPEKLRSQITGNSGLYYVAWQLSRRGWHVMPTVRNARGSDLILVNDDETVFLGVQSKALSKRQAVGLGRGTDDLRSEWWVITVRANADEPVSFVMTLAEVRALAKQDRNGGAWWLDPPPMTKIASAMRGTGLRRRPDPQTLSLQVTRSKELGS